MVYPGAAALDARGKVMTARISIDIQPVEIGDEHYVAVRIGDHETRRHGPYPDADTAEVMAVRLIRVGRALVATNSRLERR
jgi:hypothetical protein